MTSSSDTARTTEDCRYCWMCRHVCPVGHVTKRETHTPHAWALLIDSVKRGNLQWNAETADVLYQCADCGMCRTHCVTDRTLPEAIALARAEVAAAGLAPKAVYALRDGLARELTSAPSADTPRGEVALFAGSATTGEAAASLDAALALLSASGVRPATIGRGFSNGVVASTLGFPDLARSQARAVLSEIERAGSRQVLVLSAGDRYAFERVFGERLGVSWPEHVALAEVTTVLADAVTQGRLAFRRDDKAPPYAYHDPCHAPRIGRDGVAPRALLSAVMGDASARTLFWRVERAHPCGAVGGLEITQPEIAARLADARLADASAAGALSLVTDDPSCLRQLKSRSAASVTVVGLYELLAERLAS
jgi:Fe-S oxidoreductase